jgi:hypothetical protein
MIPDNRAYQQVRLLDMVRCPLRETNDCGVPSWMVFADAERNYCPEFDCPIWPADKWTLVVDGG